MLETALKIMLIIIQDLATVDVVFVVIDRIVNFWRKIHENVSILTKKVLFFKLRNKYFDFVLIYGGHCTALLLCTCFDHLINRSSR